MVAFFESLLSKVTSRGKKSAGRDGHKQLTENVIAYLRGEFRLIPEDIVALRYVSRRGSFVGMPAKFIRIFDGIKTHEQGVTVGSYRDLDKHLELVLFEGHILGTGTMCLIKKEAGTTAKSKT